MANISLQSISGLGRVVAYRPENSASTLCLYLCVQQIDASTRLAGADCRVIFDGEEETAAGSEMIEATRGGVMAAFVDPWSETATYKNVNGSHCN